MVKTDTQFGETLERRGGLWPKHHLARARARRRKGMFTAAPYHNLMQGALQPDYPRVPVLPPADWCT